MVGAEVYERKISGELSKKDTQPGENKCTYHADEAVGVRRVADHENLDVLHK